jgi:hypothetical protein
MGAFLSSRREAIAAIAFFTEPMHTLGVLYCFFAIANEVQRTCTAI